MGETRPTADDLIGFWELVNIQVDSVRSQLGALHSKKDNDWKVFYHNSTYMSKHTLGARKRGENGA